jgi:hypothetical protein
MLRLDPLAVTEHIMNASHEDIQLEIILRGIKGLVSLAEDPIAHEARIKSTYSKR